MHEIGLVVIMTQAVFANITVFKQVEGRFLTLINTLVSVGVITTLAAFYFSIAASYMPSGTPFAAFIVVSAGSLLFLWQRIKLLDNRIETLFLESFEEQLNKEEIERRHKMNEIARQYPWPVEISELEILSGSESCGKKIRALQIRSLTGATIIGVSRQDYVQYNPGIDTMIFPNDHLFLFGKEDQIKAARSLLTREKTESDDDVNRGKIKIDTLYIGLDSELNHKSLIASGLRQRYGLTVLGIQRGEEQITSPPPYFIIESGDILHVIGNSAAVKELDSSMKQLAADAV